MRFTQGLTQLLLLLLVVLAPQVWGDEHSGFGPLYDRFDLTLSPGQRTEVLGPLFSTQREGSELTVVVPPLFSTHEDPATDSLEVNVFYPILTYYRFGLDYRLQLLQFFSVSGGHTMDMEGKSRVSLFPIYFEQRSPEPALNYTALVPFYGHLQNRFFRDEISFVMLPLYLHTRKRDVMTDNYLAPFFHLRHGEGLKGWQFWPLVGREHKDPTTHTNDHETEIIGGHDKLFVLWPMFARNDLGLGTTNLQTQRLLLPFYSAQHAPLRDSVSYLWPLGLTLTVDREKQYREWAAPWPFVDFARGQGKTLNRVWPFFSQGKTPYLESDFYFWPIYKYNRITSEPLDRERTRILLYLYSDVIERNTTAGTFSERTDLWPLFTRRRDGKGSTRLQVLAPLESFLPGNTTVERNYSPLWSLWRAEDNAQTLASSRSLLWNLYRLETSPGVKKCSLFFGLFRYQSGPAGSRWRLFFLPFGSTVRNHDAHLPGG